MSAEQWVQFKSPKELERVVKLLGDIVGGMISCGDVHVRVDRKSKTSLRISYQARFYRRELALLVTRELSRRFAVTRIGADVVAAWSDQDYAAQPELCKVPADLVLLDDKFGTAKTGADLIQVLRVDHPTALVVSISGSPVSYADQWVGKGVDRETLADLCKTAAVRRGQAAR